ncbi:MAG TPA: FAD-dependent monooxygenase [bacterium]|nr:FAD-dependent monooxygenase [bacterium]
MSSYDLVVVGGGLGGSTLGKALAEWGARVLVLERETRFKDRVRGEQMHPWGVAEARRLGIYDLLRASCGHELPWWDMYDGPRLILHRDLPNTTRQGASEFTFYHPVMQEVLFQAAVAAGAEVRRGAVVRDVRPGERPSVVIECGGRVDETQARLIVGADGRNSMTRKWGRFTVRRDPERLLIAGLLFDDMPVADDTSYTVFNADLGQRVLLFPQGRGRVRAYLIYQQDSGRRFQGEGDIPQFVTASLETGAPAEFYAGARAAGPLATFDGADTWAEHPYGNGVALIGDAAASNDPSHGQGQSLTVRDVRVLRDHLFSHEHWDAAGHAYADEHDHHYGVMHEVTRWFRDLFYTRGTEGEARRARAFPLFAEDRSRVPDHLFCGPDLPIEEMTRTRFFGED